MHYILPLQFYGEWTSKSVAVFLSFPVEGRLNKKCNGSMVPSR